MSVAYYLFTTPSLLTVVRRFQSELLGNRLVVVEDCDIMSIAPLAISLCRIGTDSQQAIDEVCPDSRIM